MLDDRPDVGLGRSNAPGGSRFGPEPGGRPGGAGQPALYRRPRRDLRGDPGPQNRQPELSRLRRRPIPETEGEEGILGQRPIESAHYPGQPSGGHQVIWPSPSRPRPGPKATGRDFSRPVVFFYGQVRLKQLSPGL